MKNNLKDLRLKRGFSQTSLAEAVGTTKRTIYAIESEDQDIRISLAYKLAEMLRKKYKEIEHHGVLPWN